MPKMDWRKAKLHGRPSSRIDDEAKWLDSDRAAKWIDKVTTAQDRKRPRKPNPSSKYQKYMQALHHDWKRKQRREQRRKQRLIKKRSIHRL